MTLVKNYWDHYGQLHRKEVIGVFERPSTNDGMIHLAYYLKIIGQDGVDIRIADMFHSMAHTERNGVWYPVVRFPEQEPDSPTPSRDFFLAVIYFKLMDVSDFEKLGWNFSPYEIPKFNLIQFICQLILCAYEHRNYFWEHKFSQTYRLTYMVPIQDRAAYYRFSNRKAPWYYRFYEWANNFKKPSSLSSTFLDWFKGADINYKLFSEEFPSDHPITLSIKEKGL